MATVAIPEGASEVAILDCAVSTPGFPLSPEATRSILAQSFAPSDLQRMQVLAERAREGALTEVEQIEIENYERAGHVLSLLKSRARLALSGAPPESGVGR